MVGQGGDDEKVARVQKCKGSRQFFDFAVKEMVGGRGMPKMTVGTSYTQCNGGGGGRCFIAFFRVEEHSTGALS